MDRLVKRTRTPKLVSVTAFAGTAGVMVVMASLATVIKRDISGMGKWLFAGVLVLLVASVINIFVGSTMGMAVISTLAIAIFSAYLLYDLKQVIDGGLVDGTAWSTGRLGLLFRRVSAGPLPGQLQYYAMVIFLIAALTMLGLSAREYWGHSLALLGVMGR